MMYSIRLSHRITVKKDTGMYKVKCFTCNIIIISYNHFSTANRAKHTKNRKNSTHYNHDIQVVEQ